MAFEIKKQKKAPLFTEKRMDSAGFRGKELHFDGFAPNDFPETVAEPAGPLHLSASVNFFAEISSRGSIPLLTGLAVALPSATAMTTSNHRIHHLVSLLACPWDHP
ncbi:hypothetical protein KKC00_03110 [Patescibacteria group bacterium]|nr:hypothetical protein [Patescibacteria group bacterium]